MPNIFTQNVERKVINDRFSKSGHTLDKGPVAALDGIATFSGYQYYTDDFLNYTGPATGAAQANWNLSDTGTSVVALEANVTSGALKIQTGATDNNSAFLQRTVTGNPWTYVPGKRMWVFSKFNLSDANDDEIVFGLLPATAVGDMDTIAKVLALDDGIFFEKAETATEFDFHTRKGDVSTEATLVSATFVDGVDQILGFVADASGNIKAYGGTTFDNLVEIASVTAGTGTIPNDAAMTLMWGIETGDNAAKDITVDWVFAAQEV